MAVSSQQIVDFLIANPNMSDAEIASVMNQFGVSPSDVAAATGADEAVVQARFDEVAPTVAAPIDEPVAAPVYEAPTAPVYEAPATPVVAPVAAPTGQISKEQIVDFLVTNPQLTDAELADAMDTYKLSVSDIAKATGSKVEDIQTRYETKADTVYKPVAESPTAPVTNSLLDSPTVAAPVAPPAPPAPVAPVKESAPLSKQEVIDKLTNQILTQGTSDKWSGEGKGSAKANAADMAAIIAETGATDIKQFGKVTKTVDATVIPQYEQAMVGVDADGNQIPSTKIIGYKDQNGNAVDPKLVKTDLAQVGSGEDTTYETVYTAPVGKQEVFGNTATGKAVADTYGERQTGDAFGGTYTGKGNTGYRVDMSSGTPVFYTTGASSNDTKDLGKFLLTAGTLFGLPAGIGSALGLGTGATASAVGTGLLSGGSTLIGGGNVKDVIKATALGGGASLLGSTVSDLLTPTVDASKLTSEQLNDIINEGFATDLKKAGVTNVSEFTTNVGGNAGTFYDAAGNPVVAPPPVAIATPVAPPAAPDNLVITGAKALTPPPVPSLSSVIGTLATPPINAGTVNVEDKKIKEEDKKVTIPTVPKVPTTPIDTLEVVGSRPVVPVTPPAPLFTPSVPLVLPTIPATPSPTPPKPPEPPPKDKKEVTITDVIKTIAPLVIAPALVNAATPDKKSFPIVPIPAEWKPPTTQPATPFQPLTPIDFGNQNLLKGTQWEKFLDPNYGKVPAPTQYAQPSNLSYNDLMGILGSKQGMPPTSSLSINDVISGIQNQYGQVPSRTVG